MGRTKVRPELRRHVARACEACKSSKRRCDGQTPCGRCSRQQRADGCVYETDTNAIHQGSNLPTPSPATTRTRLTQDSTYAPSCASGSGSTRKETLFVGPSAALSFVHLLRKTIGRRALTSRLNVSTNAQTDASSGLPLQLSPDVDNEVSDLYDPQLLNTYIDRYLAVTSGILYLLSSDEIHEILEDSTSLGHKDPSALIAIAIGAQANAQNDMDRAYANGYIQLAQQRLARDFLLDPTMDQAIASLLMSFYLLLSHRRNAAYMQLGHAVRCAHALGFHLSSASHGCQGKEGVVWMSICAMNVAVSSILGRPSGAAPTLSQPYVACDDDGAQSEVTLLRKAFSASQIIEEALQQVQQSSSLQAKHAETILGRLTTWRESAKHTFRENIDPDSTATSAVVDGRRDAIAKMNIACLYYHGVILITRPYLVAAYDHCVKPSPAPTAQSSSTSRDQSSDTSAVQLNQKLAEVCTDAAIYMIEAVCGAWDSGLLLSNMCFTKAWVFSAGLVLGFAMLTQPACGPDFRQSMDRAIRYLYAQSGLSPYARQYQDILVDVVASVCAHHDRQAEQRRATNAGLLDRVLEPDLTYTAVADSNVLGQDTMQSSNVESFWNNSFVDDAEDIFLAGWNSVVPEFVESGEVDDTIWPSTFLGY